METGLSGIGVFAAVFVGGCSGVFDAVSGFAFPGSTNGVPAG